uniref:Uncharacterized protein n=1 Tax=Panagrolaimus davidi TaxID=227884 RepID=A0A914QE36_9BILA
MPLELTLKKFLTRTYTQEYVFINANDQPFGQNDGENFAHSKFFLHIHQDQGYILFHTLPRFLIDRVDLIYTIAPRMQLTKISDGFLNSNKALWNISEKIFETRPDISYIKTFKTAAGVEFDAFAKNKNADLQLWTKLIERYVKMDFFLATYWNSREIEEHEFLHNVIRFHSIFQNHTYVWEHRRDHSKFALSVARDARARICYGDINHTISHRSGIIICMKNQNLHAAIDQVFKLEIEDNSLKELCLVIASNLVSLIIMFNLMA